MKAVARKVCDTAKEILDDVLSQQRPPQAEPLPPSSLSSSSSSSSSANIPTPTLPLGAASSASAAAPAGERDVDMAWEILHSPIKVKHNDVAAVIR